MDGAPALRARPGDRRPDAMDGRREQQRRLPLGLRDGRPVPGHPAERRGARAALSRPRSRLDLPASPPQALVAYRGTRCVLDGPVGAWAADGAHEYETVGLLRAARWNSTFSRDGVSIFGAGSDNEDLHLWVDGRGVHASWFKMAST